MTEVDRLLAKTANPALAAMRLEELCASTDGKNAVAALDSKHLFSLLKLLAFSSFLSRYLNRYPKDVALIGAQSSCHDIPPLQRATIEGLRRYKYQELLKICCADLGYTLPYQDILGCLSQLADTIVSHAFSVINQDSRLTVLEGHDLPLTVFALGKLGAYELNLSSDLDLVFACTSSHDAGLNVEKYQRDLQQVIQQLSAQLEERDHDGFLYRVDLKLRPWGISGSLCMTCDEIAEYYASFAKPWERLAWLRARIVHDYQNQGEELLRTLDPLLYLRTLSTDDVGRFIQIKKAASQQHERAGNWNVKTGSGGIRDIEFFVQLLQLLHAHAYPDLKITKTVQLFPILERHGLISAEDAQQLLESYLFLRRLENHLQMIDERQVHHLPDQPEQRIVLARSLGYVHADDQKNLYAFDSVLAKHQAAAKAFFQRVLPKH